MGHEAAAAPGAEWRALDALVSDVVETRRQVAALQAREARLLSDAVDLVADRVLERRRSGRRVSDAELPLREAAAELGAAMRLSDRAVQRRMGDASALCLRFPATMRAWSEGAIDAGHAGAILDAGTVIADDGRRAEFESRLVEIAASATPTQLRAIARAVAAQLDPGSVAEAQRRAQSDRCVRVIDLGDAMARLSADLPATLAYAAHDRLTALAREVKGMPLPETAAEAASDDVEPRTIDQLRADVLADLLLAGSPSGHGDGDALASITAHVQVTVPVLTLAGLSEEPALLAGCGPIDAATARALAADAPGWDRVLTHPHTGAVLAVDRYRPSNDLRRFLRARDERCRFPGCQRTPVHCDIDHTIDAARGGSTAHENLAHFCRRHHTLKHATAWRVRQLGGGLLEWTAPTGRRHEDRPPAAVRFVPTDWHEIARSRSALVNRGDPPPF